MTPRASTGCDLFWDNIRSAWFLAYGKRRLFAPPDIGIEDDAKAREWQEQQVRLIDGEAEAKARIHEEKVAAAAAKTAEIAAKRQAKRQANPDARTSTGPWWYANRNKYNGRWAFNHSGKRYFAPPGIAELQRGAAFAWYAQMMIEIDPGWAGPRLPRTTKRGYQKTMIHLSEECLAILAQLEADHRADRCRPSERQARNPSDVFRMAIQYLVSNAPPRIRASRQPQTVAKTFSLPPEDLEALKRIARQCKVTPSRVAEYAVRRLERRWRLLAEGKADVALPAGAEPEQEVSQNGSEAVIDIDAEEQPVVEEIKMTTAADRFTDTILASWDNRDCWEQTAAKGLAVPDQDELRDICKETGDDYVEAERQVLEFVRERVAAMAD